MKTVSFVAACCCLVAGCVTKYSPPDAGVPNATLTLEKGYTSGNAIGKTTLQTIALKVNSSCNLEKQARLAFFSMWGGDETEQRLAAGRPITIMADTTTERVVGASIDPVFGAQGEYDYAACRAFVEFTPKADGQYVLKHDVDVDSGACRLLLTDSLSGETFAGKPLVTGEDCDGF